MNVLLRRLVLPLPSAWLPSSLSPAFWLQRFMLCVRRDGAPSLLEQVIAAGMG